MRLPEDVFIDILTYLPNEEEVVNCLKSKKFIDQKGILSNKGFNFKNIHIQFGFLIMFFLIYQN